MIFLRIEQRNPGNDRYPPRVTRRDALLLLTASVLPRFASAAVAVRPPSLGPDGLAAYEAYRRAEQHRAFAIAPGGAYGWSADRASAGAALKDALASCAAHTDQTCVPFDVNGTVVFDSSAWPRLWAPYPGKAEASRARIGRRRGERLPDLAWTEADGRRSSVARLRGQLAIVHLWGSWCGPCREEMPDLQALLDRLARWPKAVPAPRLVALQAREPFERSRRWATAQSIRLPFVDSGATGSQFTLADGSRLADREIAPTFPTTYVLDRSGVVLFAHHGAVHDWPGYEAFLRDATERS